MFDSFSFLFPKLQLCCTPPASRPSSACCRATLTCNFLRSMYLSGCRAVLVWLTCYYLALHKTLHKRKLPSCFLDQLLKVMSVWRGTKLISAFVSRTLPLEDTFSLLSIEGDDHLGQYHSVHMHTLTLKSAEQIATCQ